MKFLIVAPSWIGDAIMAQPLLMRLQERHPACTVDVLCPDWVSPVFERMRQVRRVLANPFRHGQFDLAGRRALGRTLRREGYDAAVVLPNSWKSALVPFFARVPQRIGFRGEWRLGLLNRIHRLDKQATPLLVERYALLAEAPGTPLHRPVPQPRLVPDEDSLCRTLAQLHLGADPAPVVFCPGAEYGPAKRWPARYFADLARRLADHGLPVWLVGSARDKAVAAEIVASSDGACIDLCGATNLAQAMDLVGTARLVVTNDSGLMHVAAALERPLVALFGSSSPDYTPPLSPQALVLRTGIECSPCFERECPLGHFRCMNDLLPGTVYSRIQDLLAPHTAC